MVVSTNGYNIRRFIGGWVTRITIVISTVVSCCRNKTDSLGVSLIDGPFHCGRISSASPGIRGQVHTNLCSVSNRFYSIGQIASPVATEEFDTNHGNIPTDTNYTFTVVSYCSNCSCTVSAMRMVIMRIIVIVCKIPPVYIINISIPIIVFSIIRDFIWVRPNVGFEIFVISVDTRINNSD